VDLWRDPATGVNTLVIVTHSVEEAVFLAGRIVVFGSNPGHVREEMSNPLPYPRQERSPEFEEMWTGCTPFSPRPSCPSRRRPHPNDSCRSTGARVRGHRLLDHLLTRPDGKGPVFELAEDLGVDYDRMSAVVRAAEQLGWVTTPGEIVQLTVTGVRSWPWTTPPQGRHEGTARQAAAVRAARGHAEGGRRTVEDEEVLADLTIYFPFIPRSRYSRRWWSGRYAELLDHDADGGRLMLLGGKGRRGRVE